jgi:bacterioferritin
MAEPGTFAMNLEEIRRRCRQSLEDVAVTPNYQGSVETTVRLLNDALATELVCILRYKFHAFNAQGINSEEVRKEFAAHAREEEAHADAIAERIGQLGGTPNFSPTGLLERSATEYVEGENLIRMIEENLVAERIAIETYR